MPVKTQPLDTLKDIKHMMERSSRFISLSGLSGVAAGCCALLGAWFAYNELNRGGNAYPADTGSAHTAAGYGMSMDDILANRLFLIAVATFLAALVLAFLFTYLRSRKHHTPIWGLTAQRLIMNVALPMMAGGIFIWKLLQLGMFGLVTPACLVFYGLALVNASKYTLKDIRYLGLAQIILGLVNLWNMGYGLHFWALGFGVLHIAYGAMMWWRYEKEEREA